MAAPQAARGQAAMARTEAATTAAREFKADEVFLHEGAYGVRVGLFGRRSGCCKSFLGERHAVVFLGPHVDVPKTLVLGLRVGGCLRPERQALSPTPTHVVPRRGSLLLCLYGRHLLLNNGRGCPGTLRLGVQEVLEVPLQVLV